LEDQILQCPRLNYSRGWASSEQVRGELDYTLELLMLRCIEIEERRIKDYRAILTGQK
jgi:hypothetical protein